MHISEGVLSAPVLVVGTIAAASGVAIGLKKIKNEDIPKVALLSATFFVCSLVHVPFGITSAHLILNGLLGILLGWAAFPAILVALFMQAILFQFGGLSTLGVNTLVMALPAIIVHFMFRSSVLFVRKTSKKSFEKLIISFVSFVCGFMAIFFSAILLGLSLYYSGDEFVTVAKIVIIAHVPVMLLEGFITSAIVLFLRKVKPETLK